MSEILTSLHGRQAGLDNDGKLIVPKGFVGGFHGNQFQLESPNVVTLFDDFLGDTLNADLYSNPTKGSDAATVDFAISQDVNGKIRGTTGAGAGASMAVNGIQISGALNWKANQGGLVFQTRVQVAAVTNMCFYVGLTDQVASLEMPFTISGSTLTSNATDAVGFLYDTAATASTIKLVGVANDVDATLQEAVQSTSTTTTSPTAATYQTFRVEVSTAGVATFYIDGRQVGTAMSGAVTATVALAPVIAIFRRSATSTAMDVDYIHVAANRV